jgi:hypothetical protein
VSFENFWNTYDKNVDKGKCEILWNALTKSERVACLEKLPSYVLGTPDKQWRKHPEKYLRNKSWNNEISSSANLKNPDVVTYDNPITDETK